MLSSDIKPSHVRAVLVLATVLTVLGGIAPAAFAATRSVAPGGADRGDCLGAACGSLGYAYTQSAPGDVVSVAPGVYGEQRVPSGSKALTFLGGPGVKVRQLWNDASNLTYDGINIDANFVRKQTGLQMSGDRVTFKNASIGNIADEKNVISGYGHVIDNVSFHDTIMTSQGSNEGVHMECLYAIVVPNLTIRNSSFRDCAVMDLFFTYGTWWSPLPPSYGNVTIENNVFAHSEQENSGGWNYYSLYVNFLGPNGSADPMSGWTVRNNTFEQTAYVLPDRGAGGSRWVGNLGDWGCKSGVAYNHNVGKKCSATDKSASPASSRQGTGAALGWVNPAGNDFRLRAGSPAIDAGDPNDFPLSDRYGLLRNGRPDAGAHEYGGQAPGGGATPGGPPGPSGSPGGKAGAPGRGGSPGSGPGQTSPRKGPAQLGRRVICKRKARGPGKRRRACARFTRLRLTVASPTRVSVRIFRLRPGKNALARSLKIRVRSTRTLRIRARTLRRGRYRVVVKTISASGARSAPQRLRLRVR